MKTLAGLWVDYQEAVIVTFAGGSQENVRVKSGLELQKLRGLKPAGGFFADRETPPRQESREQDYQAGLGRFYDEVLSHLQAVDEILLFGPGEARIELKRRIKEERGDAVVIAFEMADKMTVPQIMAQVRMHFFPTRFQLTSGLPVSQPAWQQRAA